MSVKVDITRAPSIGDLLIVTCGFWSALFDEVRECHLGMIHLYKREHFVCTINDDEVKELFKAALKTESPEFEIVEESADAL